VFFDYSDLSKFKLAVIEVLTILESKGAKKQSLHILSKWLNENAASCYKDCVGIIHGDLSGQNVLIEDDIPKFILDWQRPMYAPMLLENAIAFLLAGYNTVKYFGDFGKMALVCNIIWYAKAYSKWLPLKGVIDYAIKTLDEFAAIDKSIYIM
jgi:hypothetical protein